MIRKTVIVVALLAVAYSGFRWGPAVFPPLERALGIAPARSEGEEVSPSAELAEATLDRLEQFRAGDLGSRLAIGSLELTSIVRYSLPGILPEGVSEPTVELADGRVELAARVAVDAFPSLPRLDRVIGLLPDTLLIEIRGNLVPLDQRFLALIVDRLYAAKLPIPKRMVGDVLAALGRGGSSALPVDAIQVPRPDGLEAVFVQRDSLILLAEVVDDPAVGGN